MDSEYPSYYPKTRKVLALAGAAALLSGVVWWVYSRRSPSGVFLASLLIKSVSAFFLHSTASLDKRFQLVDRTQITHNTIKLRFSLGDGKAKLGSFRLFFDLFLSNFVVELPVGHHLVIR